LSKIFPDIVWGDATGTTVWFWGQARPRLRFQRVVAVIVVIVTIGLPAFKKRLKTDDRHLGIVQALPCINSLAILQNLKDARPPWERGTTISPITESAAVAKVDSAMVQTLRNQDIKKKETNGKDLSNSFCFIE